VGGAAAKGPREARTLATLKTVSDCGPETRSEVLEWKDPGKLWHPAYPHHCVSLQVQHRSEVQELQVRLEEAQQ
jgi:hypothetical protein